MFSSKQEDNSRLHRSTKAALCWSKGDHQWTRDGFLICYLFHICLIWLTVDIGVPEIMEEGVPPEHPLTVYVSVIHSSCALKWNTYINNRFICWKIAVFLCVWSGTLPGVKAEATRAFAAPAGPIVARLLSAVRSLRNTHTHKQRRKWPMRSEGCVHRPYEHKHTRRLLKNDMCWQWSDMGVRCAGMSCFYLKSDTE